MEHAFHKTQDGPGLARLRRAEQFEAMRLDTLRLQEEALAAARKNIKKSKRS
jgi:hypothetical protein